MALLGWRPKLLYDNRQEQEAERETRLRELRMLRRQVGAVAQNLPTIQETWAPQAGTHEEKHDAEVETLLQPYEEGEDKEDITPRGGGPPSGRRRGSRGLPGWLGIIGRMSPCNTIHGTA